MAGTSFRARYLGVSPVGRSDVSELAGGAQGLLVTAAMSGSEHGRGGVLQVKLPADTEAGTMPAGPANPRLLQTTALPLRTLRLMRRAIPIPA